MKRPMSKAAKIVVSIAVLLLVAGVVLWERCGIKGCPDVEQLAGYMPDRASVVLDHNGQEIGKLFLTRRVVTRLDSLPKHVPDAFIAMEDKRFWKHHGVDWTRVFGAAYKNIRELGITEGSSTITMQLARNVFPEHLPANQRKFWRKIGEARVARSIEKEYSKEQILELYLNQIYFGHGAYGIEAASEEYFGKPASKLTLSEAATLAALPRAPSKLNPRSNRDLAMKGREIVLARMQDQGLISAEEAEQAGKARLRLRRGVLKTNESAPLFRRCDPPPAGRSAGRCDLQRWLHDRDDARSADATDRRRGRCASNSQQSNPARTARSATRPTRTPCVTPRRRRKERRICRPPSSSWTRRRAMYAR